MTIFKILRQIPGFYRCIYIKNCLTFMKRKNDFKEKV